MSDRHLRPTFLTESFVVFDASVFKLSHLVKLIKGHEVFLKVISIEFFKIFEAKHAIFLQLSLKNFSNLLLRNIAEIEHLLRLNHGRIDVDLFVLDDVDAGLEEAVLLRPPDDLFRHFDSFLPGALAS